MKPYKENNTNFWHFFMYNWNAVTNLNKWGVILKPRKSSDRTNTKIKKNVLPWKFIPFDLLYRIYVLDHLWVRILAEMSVWNVVAIRPMYNIHCITQGRHSLPIVICCIDPIWRALGPMARKITCGPLKLSLWGQAGPTDFEATAIFLGEN